MTISFASRQRIRDRANFLCEYCHSFEEASSSLFTIDHLIPQSLGGGDTEDNLALACHRCNGRRYNFTEGIDPETQTIVSIFNPRQNKWSEHFIWSDNGQKILGITATGRATIERLDMNDERHIEPYNWIIGNDKSKWLPAVDPTQRETILSIGAFIQNLEYAAGSFGYVCHWNLLAKTNQDEQVAAVKLNKIESKNPFDISKIKERRTVRSNFLNDELKTEDLQYLINLEPEFIHYLPPISKEGQFINEQTIVANRIQTYRDPAQQELADWIRFSTKDADKYRDGLTTASMEIEGFSGWIVRNFYNKDSVMKKNFREVGLDKVWSLWHLPLWFIKGSPQSSFPFGLYLFSGVVLTSSFTTLYKYTNNLFLCIIKSCLV